MPLNLLLPTGVNFLWKTTSVDKNIIVFLSHIGPNFDLHRASDFPGTALSSRMTSHGHARPLVWARFRQGDEQETHNENVWIMAMMAALSSCFGALVGHPAMKLCTIGTRVRSKLGCEMVRTMLVVHTSRKTPIIASTPRATSLSACWSVSALT